MRVLLVYANQSRDLLPPPPVGLAYVASATQGSGHEVELVDLLTARDGTTSLCEALRRFRPAVVGVSVRSIDNVVPQRWTSHLDSAAEIVALLRRESDAAVVVGGPAVSILSERALATLDADFAVIGEGEHAFPQLLSELADGRRFAAVPGLAWRDGARINVNPAVRPVAFGPSRLGEWVRWGEYERLGSTWPIQTKRGCPLGCVYCAYPAVEGACHRLREPEEVVDEIEEVSRRFGPGTFEFVDSTFNLPHDHALAVCEEIIRRGLVVRLAATTINPLEVSRELFDLMRRAGFIAVMVTPESASDATLAGLGKGFSKDAVIRTAELVTASGIASAWFFLLGGPGETEATADETVSFIERRLRSRDQLTVVTTGVRVFPGSPLARDEVAAGRLQEDFDFSRPYFYLSPAVTERWLLERVNRAIRTHPGVVHAAEETDNFIARVYGWVLRRRGEAPPYWRFLPRLLATPPLRAVRGRSLRF